MAVRPPAASATPPVRASPTARTPPPPCSEPSTAGTTAARPATRTVRTCRPRPGRHAARRPACVDVARCHVGGTRSTGADMSRSINLAVIPGDGIGQEVVAQGLKVLSAVLPQDVKLETKEYDLGAQRWHATGETLPDAELDALKKHDAILLGAIGDPSRAVRRAGARAAAQAPLRLRPLRQPASVEALPEHRDPAGRPPRHRLRRRPRGHRGPVHRQRRLASAPAPRTRSPPRSAVNTAFGVERVVRDAFERAQARPRKKLTLVHKNNVLVLRRSPVEEHLRQGRPGVPRGHHRLPARRRGDDLLRHPARALRRHRHRQPLRRHPHRPRRRRHRRHRPRRLRQHQPDRRRSRRCSSPSTARRPTSRAPGKADPTATILSVALLLRHLGYEAEAARIEDAVSADLAERDGSPSARTDEIGDALAVRVAG